MWHEVSQIADSNFLDQDIAEQAAAQSLLVDHRHGKGWVSSDDVGHFVDLVRRLQGGDIASMKIRSREIEKMRNRYAVRLASVGNCPQSKLDAIAAGLAVEVNFVVSEPNIMWRQIGD